MEAKTNTGFFYQSLAWFLRQDLSPNREFINSARNGWPMSFKKLPLSSPPSGMLGGACAVGFLLHLEVGSSCLHSKHCLPSHLSIFPQFACVWTEAKMWMCVCHHSPLIYWDMVSHWTWSSLIRPDFGVGGSKPQVFPSLPPYYWDYRCKLPCSQISEWVLKIKLRSWYMHDMHLLDWLISPTPKLTVSHELLHYNHAYCKFQLSNAHL